jgi:hypothetical protein
MNDTTSNTPDNASRPGNNNVNFLTGQRKQRPRDEHGRFLNKAQIEQLRTEGRLESEVTVGEFLDFANCTIEDTLDRAFVELKDDIKRSTAKKKREKTVDIETARRATRLYQVRNIKGTNKFGLFYADGVPLSEAGGKMYEKAQLVQHWFGAGGYEARHANAAVQFDTALEAKTFRLRHFNLSHDFVRRVDEYDEKNKQVRGSRRLFRRVLGNRMHRDEVRRQSKNKTMRKVQVTRADILELRKLTR